MKRDRRERIYCFRKIKARFDSNFYVLLKLLRIVLGFVFYDFLPTRLCSDANEQKEFMRKQKGDI